MLRRHHVKLQPWTPIGTLIHFPNFSFSQISMLLEDKELKESIPLQLNKGRGWAFAKRNQKINSFMKFFKSSKAITRGWGSKIILRNKTLTLHFQISNPTFFLSLSHFEGILRSCSQLYTMLL